MICSGNPQIFIRDPLCADTGIYLQQNKLSPCPVRHSLQTRQYNVICHSCQRHRDAKDAAPEEVRGGLGGSGLNIHQ